MTDKIHISDFDKDAFLKKVRKTIGKVPFSRDVVAMYYCLLDPNTPLWVKATIISALVYFVCPTDAIPDIIPLTGYTDDASIIATAMATIRTYLSQDHLDQANKYFDR